LIDFNEFYEQVFDCKFYLKRRIQNGEDKELR